MTNAAVMLTYNNLELTKEAVASVYRQDIPVTLLVIDDVSSDGTREWLQSSEFPGIAKLHTTNRGATAGYNEGLRFWFENTSVNHVLTMNNDIILPSWYFRTLLSCGRDLISGYTTDDMNEIVSPKPHGDAVQGGNYGAWLQSRHAWDVVGPFDESMIFYASDCDYGVRAHRKGIVQSEIFLPYYHFGSATLRKADPESCRRMEIQADADRAVFQSKWGCIPGDEGWPKLLTPEFFGVDNRK
jgi:GT2 family glycosyltransferase